MLERVFINMDSRVLLDYKSDQNGDEGIQIAEDRYLSSVCFDTLFLCSITKTRGYRPPRTLADEYVDPEEMGMKNILRTCSISTIQNFCLTWRSAN